MRNVGGGGGGGEDVWLVAVLICYQAICIREECCDATFYHLQYYVMSGIVAPEVQ